MTANTTNFFRESAITVLSPFFRKTSGYGIGIGKRLALGVRSSSGPSNRWVAKERAKELSLHLLLNKHRIKDSMVLAPVNVEAVAPGKSFEFGRLLASGGVAPAFAPPLKLLLSSRSLPLGLLHFFSLLAFSLSAFFFR